MRAIRTHHRAIRAGGEGSTQGRRCDGSNRRAIEEAKEKAVEEFFAILFIYLADRQKYGKAIEDMENEMLQKKDPFPKDVSDASGLLDG